MTVGKFCARLSLGKFFFCQDFGGIHRTVVLIFQLFFRYQIAADWLCKSTCWQPGKFLAGTTSSSFFCCSTPQQHATLLPSP